MAVKIVVPGALSTVQDEGRFGYQYAGIGTSGVMDMDSYQRANYLVGNTRGEAVLELTLFGGIMEFTDTHVIAAVGAKMDMSLNGKEISMGQPHLVKAGDTLSLGVAREGCRAYLAFGGGVEVPVVMGSRSTNLKCQMGGFQGRMLKAGDILPLGQGVPYEAVKDRQVPDFVHEEVLMVHVIEGPQAEYFTEKGKRTFYNERYTVSEKSDRMGYRMEGAAIESVNGTDIISDGIALGAIQVPADGHPIVLMADRQTTGGYAKIATVCSFDIPKLAQRRPGEQVQFVPITLEEAAKYHKNF